MDRTLQRRERIIGLDTSVCFLNLFLRLEEETRHVVAVRQTLRASVLEDLELCGTNAVAPLYLQRCCCERLHKLALRGFVWLKGLTSTKPRQLLQEDLSGVVLAGSRAAVIPCLVGVALLVCYRTLVRFQLPGAEAGRVLT